MPPKAAYKRFEAEPDVWFEFFLAKELGKTVDEIRGMPYQQFIELSVWYAREKQRDELAQKRGSTNG